MFLGTKQTIYTHPKSLGRRMKKRAIIKSDIDESGIFLQLLNIALSRFEWEGLPDTCDARFLELMLLYNGRALFFRDEVMGDLSLAFTPGGRFDVYQTPLIRNAYATNGYRRKCNKENSVVIWNNMTRTGIYPQLLYYAERLHHYDQIIDVNVNAQKTPLMIQASENERLTMVNLYNEYEGNIPVIFGTKNLNLQDVNVLKTDAPYVADKIHEEKAQIWNECMTFLGIPNSSMEKRERLIVDEVDRMMGGVLSCQQSDLKARQTACEQINKMFDLNVSVELAEHLRPKEGGDLSGDVYRTGAGDSGEPGETDSEKQ